MTSKEVLDFQQKLAKEFKYKPIPITLFYGDVRQTFLQELPEWCVLDGADTPVYTLSGQKIASGYERIVIGDYGAFLEFSQEQAEKGNLKIPEEQQWRIKNGRYAKTCKYLWYTSTDNSGVKIYLQKRTVDYADYQKGMFYVSPYEVQIKQ